MPGSEGKGPDARGDFRDDRSQRVGRQRQRRHFVPYTIAFITRRGVGEDEGYSPASSTGSQARVPAVPPRP